MKYYQGFLSIVLLLLLSSSCVIAQDASPQSTDVLISSRTPRVTITETSTEAPPLIFPKRILGKTHQLFIDPDGPWLVFASGDYRHHVASISDLEIGLQQDFESPHPSDQDEYQVVTRMLPYAWAGQGNLTALLWRSSSSRDFEIAFYRLPDASPYLLIPLTSEATFSVEEENCTTYDCSVLYSLGPIFTGDRVFRWSPDGRYLAYTSAFAGPHSDLYLLDIIDGQTQQLTHTEAEVQIIGWSPSGETLLYEESVSVEEAGFKPSRLILFELISGDASIIETYPEEWTWPYDVSLIGWTEDGNLVLTTYVFELGETSLRLLYVDLPSSSLLYDGFVTNPVLDSSLSRVYFSIFPSDYQGFFPDEPSGLYASDLKTGQLTMITPSREAIAIRLIDLRAISMSNTQGTVLQFDDGRQVLLLPFEDDQCEACRSFPWPVSPDGTRLLLYTRDHEEDVHFTDLFEIRGDEVSYLARFDFWIRLVSWLPDSNGVVLLSDGDIFLSSEVSNWEPIQIASNVYSYFFVLINP